MKGMSEECQKLLEGFSPGFIEALLYLSDRYYSQKLDVCEKIIRGVWKRGLSYYILDGTPHLVFSPDDSARLLDIEFDLSPEEFMKNIKLANDRFLLRIEEWNFEDLKKAIHSPSFWSASAPETSHLLKLIDRSRDFTFVSKGNTGYLVMVDSREDGDIVLPLSDVKTNSNDSIRLYFYSFLWKDPFIKNVLRNGVNHLFEFLEKENVELKILRVSGSFNEALRSKGLKRFTLLFAPKDCNIGRDDEYISTIDTLYKALTSKGKRVKVKIPVSLSNRLDKREISLNGVALKLYETGEYLHYYLLDQTDWSKPAEEKVLEFDFDLNNYVIYYNGKQVGSFVIDRYGKHEVLERKDRVELRSLVPKDVEKRISELLEKIKRGEVKPSNLTEEDRKLLSLTRLVSSPQGSLVDASFTASSTPRVIHVDEDSGAVSWRGDIKGIDTPENKRFLRKLKKALLKDDDEALRKLLEPKNKQRRVSKVKN